MADSSDVDMDEIRARVESDAARGQAERGVLHLDERAIGHADVDRHALDMQAVRRDAVGHRREHRVGRRRAIGRNDLEGFARAQFRL